MDMFYGLLENIAMGFGVALSPMMLVYSFAGVFLGTLIGVLPGIGAITAISMLMPITFYLSPTAAVIMLGGIYYGSSYGGSVASILINVPGTPSAAVVCLDGYPMTRNGRGGVALLLSALASFFGGCVGILLMMLASPLIVNIAVEFGPTEYFSLMLLGLIAASAMSSGAMLKGLAMVVLGVLFGVVGMDMETGIARFSFGLPTLYEGISLVALAMGLFGICEVICSARASNSTPVGKVTFRSMVPSKEDMNRVAKPAMRGAGIGAFLGVLPGVGSTVSSYLSYALERKLAKDPERFGKGAVEGVVGPESSTNAGDQTSFIPTMTLGIPGSATMALILGVLVMHGITPGPTLIVNQPDMFWGLVMSFWIGNLMLLVLNVPLIGVWVKMMQVPYQYLYPAILMFVCVGVYAVSLNPLDVVIAVIFGAVGYLMRSLGFPIAPMLIGFILGPMMEQHFRRAMIMSNGEFGIFMERPISFSILVGIAMLLLWSALPFLRKARARRASLSQQKHAEVHEP